MRNTYTILILFFSFSCCLQSQEKLLSKEAAVSLALENNFGIKVAKNQVEIAANNKGILNSVDWPWGRGTAGAN